MLIFSGFLHNSSLATSNYDFTRSTQAWWQNSIYYQQSTSSLDHCASICEISYISNYLCDVFAFDGSTCHIGNKDKLSHTHNVPAGMSILYSDPGKIISEVLAIRCHQIMFHCRSSPRRIESLPDSGGNQHYMVSKGHTIYFQHPSSATFNILYFQILCGRPWFFWNSLIRRLCERVPFESFWVFSALRWRHQQVLVRQPEHFNRCCFVDRQFLDCLYQRR